VIAPAQLSVDGVLRTQRLQVLATLATSITFAVLGGFAAAVLTESGHSVVVAVCAGAILPILYWRQPAAAIALLVFFGGAVARYGDPLSSVDILARAPLWQSLNTAGLSGVVIMPIELVLGLALLIWIAKEGAARRLEVPRTDLSISLAILVGVALVAEIHGLLTHGDFRISLYELRPFVYLAGGYLLASQALRSPTAFRAVLWAFVLGVAYRGLIGTHLAHQMANVYPKPNELLEHDESFFFGIYLVLVAALWLFRRRGWLRRVATALAPFVLYADLANNRRAAWIILPAGLLILAIIIWVRHPTRRRLIGWIMAVLLVVAGGYVFAFRNSESTIAFPAHAIWSNFQPDPRDASSNLYRDMENMALATDIKAATIFGTGFGHEFGHGWLGYDASSYDPLVFFIPHNSVLWLWVKMGVFGMFAFWWMAGVSVITAARVARRGEPDMALIATLGITAVAGYFFLGWVDVGLAAVRVAVVVGCLLGAAEAAARFTYLERSMILDEPNAAVVIRPVPTATASAARRAPAAGSVAADRVGG
jgi:O-Antigen ligase